MIKLNLLQTVFAISLIITTTILNGMMTADDTQIAVAEQQGKPPPHPEPDCSIHTDDGRIIYVPCNPAPPVVDTTKTKSSLSNDGGIDKGAIQKIPSSSFTTNSLQSTDNGNANTQKQGDTELTNTQSTMKQNDADGKSIQTDNLGSTSESSD